MLFLNPKPAPEPEPGTEAERIWTDSAKLFIARTAEGVGCEGGGVYHLQLAEYVTTFSLILYSPWE